MWKESFPCAWHGAHLYPGPTSRLLLGVTPFHHLPLTAEPGRQVRARPVTSRFRGIDW